MRTRSQLVRSMDIDIELLPLRPHFVSESLTAHP
jgi:hypothetical protein